MNDLKFALRQLVKNPGFTGVAVLTLALGIGANTAIFTTIDKLLMRPLPVANPEQLVLVGQARGPGQVEFDFNYPLFLDYQRENSAFSQLTATAEMDVGLGTGGATERQRAMLVSGNYFTMLGVNAALGRTFAANEGREIDDAAVAVLSYGLWQRGFGAEPQVIGRRVTVNGRPFTVIGVAPREFTGTSRATVPDMYLPITTYGQLTGPLPGGEHPLRTRYFTWLYIMGRLKNPVTREQTQSGMNVLASQIYSVSPANTSTNIAILPGARGFTHDLKEARLPLNLLFATAALVLLIACANLASLQIARATGRTREFAIRAALGAKRARLIRELLSESLILSLGGGAMGLLAANWFTSVLEHFRPAEFRVEFGTVLDNRVLLFTLTASVLTGIVFGLVPALRASRPQLVVELKAGGGTTDSHPGRWTLRSALVVFQVALSLVVLVSAGLCARSLGKLQQLDPGFEPSRVLLMSFNLELNNYTEAQSKQFYDQLLERVRGLPGVEAASLGLTTPLSGRGPATSVERIEGYQPGPREYPFGEFNIIDADYFRALGIPLLRGRDFNSADAFKAAPVVIVNEAFAHRYWPGQDPIGKRIFQHGPNGGIATEVVGLAQSTHSRYLGDSPRPGLYFPRAQKLEGTQTLVVRSGVEPSTAIRALREMVKSLDANVPVFNIRTLAQQKDGSLAMQRMAATLLSGFGLLALSLAALGIYGTLAYAVSRRTREIGVRMALGAQMRDVLALVLRQGVTLAGVGILLGLIAAFGATRLLRGFLYQVEPTDSLTIVSVLAVLGIAAALACWWPARCAAKVDPLEALRYE
ncbi:MAG TPA: ABC transporter permease [Candidatus Limnocylindrales bacterium]|jgi:predicted permease|nr:ABC transporter permease [Candidatus Limnocylindrales bacterium]